MTTAIEQSPLVLASLAACDHTASQQPFELAALAGILQHPRRVLEVGSEYGGTLWYWMRLAADDAQIMSIDADQSKNRAAARAQQTLLVYQGDSHDPDTRQVAEDFFDGPIDFLFIDGDHSYEGTRADWELYRPLVSPNGVIAFHDVMGLPDGPGRLWRELEGEASRLLLSADHLKTRDWGPGGPGIGVIVP